MTTIKALIETRVFEREILPRLDTEELVTLSAVNKDLQSLVVPIALKQLCKMGRFFSYLNMLGKNHIRRYTARLKVTPDIGKEWLELYSALLKNYFNRVEFWIEQRESLLFMIPPEIRISNIPQRAIIQAARVGNLFFLKAFDYVQYTDEETQVQAASSACYSGSIPCIKYFIEKKIIGSPHYPFQRALYDSAVSKNFKAVLCLSKPGRGDIKATTEKGENILHFALYAIWGTFYCPPEFLKALLTLNASVHQVNHLNDAPLTLAIRARDPELVELLKKNGAQMREHDKRQYIVSLESVTKNITYSQISLGMDPLDYATREKTYDYQKRYANLRKIRELFPASFSSCTGNK